MRRELELFHKQDRYKNHCAVQESGGKPTLDVRVLMMASEARWSSSDHSRMTSRLTC